MDKWRETVDFVRLEMLLANCGSEWVKICIHTETQTRSQGLFILYCQFIQCKLEIFFAVNFCSKKRKLVIKISKCKNCLYDWLKMTDFFAGDCWVFAKICFFGQGFWKCYALFSILFPVSLSYSVSQIKKRVPSCLDKNQQYFLLMTCSQEANKSSAKKFIPYLGSIKPWSTKIEQRKCFNAEIVGLSVRYLLPHIDLHDFFTYTAFSCPNELLLCSIMYILTPLPLLFVRLWMKYTEKSPLLSDFPQLRNAQYREKAKMYRC